MVNDGVKPFDKKKIIAVVSALIPEAKIYLYGSRARGTYQSTSDIDLALDAGHPIEPYGRISELKSVLSELSTVYTIDVIDLQRVDEGMRASVEEDKVLWEKLSQLKRKYTSLCNAHKRFSELIELMKQFHDPHQQMYDVVRDSAIKRFEFTIDPLWKFLKAYIAEVHKITIENPGPRVVYRQAEKLGIILTDEDPIFMEMVEDRNITAHDYNVFIIELIKDKLPLYCKTIGDVLQELSYKKRETFDFESLSCVSKQDFSIFLVL